MSNDLEGQNDVVNWVERGADCNEWNLEPLISDLTNLISSEGTEFILLDYPFARLHDKLKNIDLTIFIDTPLDIAMARRILRDFRDKNAESILDDLSLYLSGGRSGYESMLKTIKPNSDLIIDGLLPIEEIVNIICDKIKS